MVFQYEEQRPDLHAACVLADVLSWQLYHRILFQPDVAGQHCHAAACDDGDRADFKRREGQSVLHFPVLCIILQLLHRLYALPVFLPLFCGSVDQCKRDQDQKHHYFSSQFRLACPACRRYGCRGTAAGLCRTWRYGVCGEQFSKPDQAVCQ